MKSSLMAVLTAAALSFASMGAVLAQDAMAPAPDATTTPMTKGVADCPPTAAGGAETGGSLSGASTEAKDDTPAPEVGDSVVVSGSSTQDGAVAPAVDCPAAVEDAPR